MRSTENQRDEWDGPNGRGGRTRDRWDGQDRWHGHDRRDEGVAGPGGAVDAPVPAPVDAAPAEASGGTPPPPLLPSLSLEWGSGPEPDARSGGGGVDLKKVRARETGTDAEAGTDPGVVEAGTADSGEGGHGLVRRSVVVGADDPVDLRLDLDLDVVDAVAAVGRGTAAPVFPPDLDAGQPDAGAHAAVTVSVGDPVAWWGTGRRQPVIANETTAPIPVHLLFRDDENRDRPHGHGGGAPGPGGPERRPAVRRPPLPRSPGAQRTPTRPAPLADPRLTERPGPVLPGWAALLTAGAATAAGLAVLGWQGALPAAVTGRIGLGPRPYDGLGVEAWAPLALLAVVVLLALGGIGRGRAGYASVLTLFGDYRGSVRRTGLLWVSPLLLRRRVDVRLRHWRSEPLPAVDASGTALRVVVLVVWRVRDTARATLGVADHERYLRDQVEAALARVLSQLPADAFHEETSTLRDAETVGDALTRMLKADCAPVGVEVYSAQPTGIEYAPEVAAAMQRLRVAAIDARHRDGVLTSVVDAVDDTVGRLTARGIVELDDYEHKALVRDLTVAFYTGRGSGEGA
ncbi:SPFH domain-containing protein [Streptomyces sp. NPDC058637]|uniref:SPFH domain-containing protein n=1 Tax=Streptomyces sp. NPDC058637 TaxID=3346569 RepID=UPI00364EAD51